MADRDEVLGKLAHLRRRAYKPVLSDGDGVATDSKLGGTPYLQQGSDWPLCGNCEDPIALAVQINPAQLPEPLRKEFGTDLIQFFYCTSDKPLCVDEAEAWEPYSTASICRQVAIAGDSATPTRRPLTELGPFVIRSWQSADDYPHWEERAQLGVELDDSEADLANDLNLSGDKLSGWPHWVQGIEYPDCSECGKTMRLVFQVDSGGSLEVNLGDMGCGHLTQCKVHKNVLAFGWACG